MEKNRYIHYGIVLTTIAFLSALILATANKITAPIIAQNAKNIVNLARIKVLPSAKTFSEEEGKTVENMLYIPGKNEAGEVVGFVVSASENGYAGPIEFVLGIGVDGKVSGLDIVGSQETPGLGSKINDDTWKKLWVGRDSHYEFNKSVDAFAGATISPAAVHKGVIRVLNVFEKSGRMAGPIVEKSHEEKANEAKIKVLPLAKTFDESAAKNAGGMKYIPGKNEAGEIVGYVVSTSEEGYADVIEFMLGIGMDGKITGLEIEKSYETAGLGSKIENKSWKNLWIGRDKNHKYNNDVDGFAGATISPKAVYDGMMRALETFEKEVK